MRKGSTRLLFIPRFDDAKRTSERSPRLQQMLSERYDVFTVPRGRFSRMVYDPSVPKPARYFLFLIDTVSSVIACVRTMKRERVQIVFGEGTYFSMIGCIAARIRSIPSIWDNHGNIWTLVSVQGKSAFFLRVNEVLERRLFGGVRSLVVVSEQERRVYQDHGFEPSKIEVLPTCVEVPTKKEDEREAARKSYGITRDEKAILFFAMLGYGPNREAAEYIATELAPAVRGSNPEAVFYIAGGGGKIPSGEGVHALGFVDDLERLISTADICIAPIWRGVGIFTKVLDMMASGRPTVASALAKEGIPELETGVNCFLASDRGAFTKEIVALAQRADGAEAVGNDGRRLVEERYSCRALRSRLYGIIDSAIEGKG